MNGVNFVNLFVSDSYEGLFLNNILEVHLKYYYINIKGVRSHKFVPKTLFYDSLFL